MEISFQPNTCYVHASLFLQLTTTASWGGALSSTNKNHIYFFDNTIFHNCSAKNRGGAFYLICHSFLFRRSCCSFCYCKVSENSGWGHSGTTMVTERGDAELSSVTRCAHIKGLGGHISFDIENGDQSFSHFNASHCESYGDVYGYGAHILNVSFCVFANLSMNGFTVRKNDKIDLFFSKLVFVDNPEVGFIVDSRDFKSHNTFLYDSFFGNNMQDVEGSLIHVARCTTTKPFFTGVTVGDGCNCNSTISHNVKDPMESGNVCDTGVVLNRAPITCIETKRRCIATLLLFAFAISYKNGFD